MTNEQIRRIADAFLSDNPSYEEVEQAADGVIAAAMKIYKETLERQYVIDVIVADRKIYQPVSSMIQDDDEGANWLSEFRASGQCSFRLWTDYKRYLTLPAPAIVEIDRSTDYILNKLANPKMSGNWYRAGLVVGHVQSGKTGNFVGLANKAMDCGYKIILVLTGMYNDLRSQTQCRIDKGVIGRVTNPDAQDYRKNIGVGAFLNHPNIINLTSSKLKGDFGSQKTDIGGVLSSADPTIMVCKKNSSILTNILRLFSQHGVIADDGYPIIVNTSLLIIDDEADSASINTEYNRGDISKINSKIRAILSLFEKRCYVGYTATPYANIFIDPDPVIMSDYIEEDGKRYRLCKDDLFPKNFIINLSAPSNYIGPNVLFGIPTVYDDLEKSPLPIIEYIKEDDYLEDYNKGKKKKILKSLPATLIEATKLFFVSTALRRARGQKTSHSSMLINVSQYIRKMDDIVKLMQVLVSELCDRIEALNDNKSLENELENLYNNKIKVSNKKISEEYPEWVSLLRMKDWQEVRNELPIVAAKVRNEVRVIHSSTDDDIELNTTRLDYDKYENRPHEFDNGLYVIVIGGNTMARGITLEGLVVSYFFRTSNTFDTLMQMGRWFGYRDGYIDACRLYLDKETETNFRCIAVATQKMRDDFDDMRYRGIKPRDYGLKVMRFPGVLEATSRNKFGATVKGRLSLNKTTLQAYKIRRDSEINAQNMQYVIDFLGKLGHSNHKMRFGVPSHHYFWKCTGNDIIDFIDKFRIATEQMPASLLKAYISRQIGKGNLIEWTVVLANVQKKGEVVHSREFVTSAETIKVGPAVRGNNDSSNSEFYVANNAAISGPVYESLDLDDDEYRQALKMTISQWQDAKEKNETKRVTEPTSPFANCSKKVRKSTNGLLLLFNMDFGDGKENVFTYVLSLPQIADKDETSISYEYRGNMNAFKLIDDEQE